MPNEALGHYLRDFKFIPEKYSKPQGRITVIQ